MADENKMTLDKYFDSYAPIKLGAPFRPFGSFPLVDASDIIVEYDDNTKTEKRLDKKLSELASQDYVNEKLENVSLTGARGIIDADELPTQDINANVIYRVQQYGFKNVYIKDEDVSGTVKECLAERGITNCSVYAKFVSTFPSVLVKSEIKTGGRLTLYIKKETGIAYCNIDNVVMTLGKYWFNQETFDYGWTNDIDAEQAAGVYCLYERCYKYYIYENGVWKELADTGYVEKLVEENFSSIVDDFLGGVPGGVLNVEQLPTENVKDNVVYRLIRDTVKVYYALDNGDLIDGRAYLGDPSFMALTPKAVDTLPPSNALEQGRVYVNRYTGIAYVYFNVVQTLGEKATGMTGLDKGFLNGATEGGCFYSEIDTVITYHAYKYGIWSELAETKNVAQVVETAEEMDNILKNATKETVGKYYQYAGPLIVGGGYRPGYVYKVKEIE